LEITIRTQDQVKIIKLRGAIKLGESLDRLSETFKEQSDAGESRLLLDLEEVPMIDSSGIGLLVRALTNAKKRGGAVKLLKPSKFVLQTLKLVALIKLFEIFDDLSLAVASFR